MVQALYYKPSYERLKKEIDRIAPDLEIALLDEAGQISLHGRAVSMEDIQPEYFWLHSELYGSPLRRDYFNMMLACRSARWLHTINTGLDHLPYLELLKQGMTITNNHAQAIAIAEFVIGQVLARLQFHAQLRQQQQEKLWKYVRFEEIYGSHWLLVGFGHIGQELARRLRAFGVKVTAVRRSTDTAGLADQVLAPDRIAEALPSADVVVLACTANADTRNLVDAAFLQQLKSSAILVNIARGDLLVEEDLKAALDAGALDYAILDVFRKEPVPAESWFWQHPRVALSPHSSNGGSGMKQRSIDLFLENLRRQMAGETLLNVVGERDIL